LPDGRDSFLSQERLEGRSLSFAKSMQNNPLTVASRPKNC
jgi:hypothetical protein